MIKIACSGFPVGKKYYETKLKTVELARLFDSFPRPATIEKWGEAVDRDFEYVVCASKVITHPQRLNSNRVGYFQDTPEVRQAFGRTWHVAEKLRARIVFFQCPPNLSPHADHVQRIQSFFRVRPNGKKHFVWEPPPTWPSSLVESLGRSLNISSAANPLGKYYKSINSPMRYFRLGAAGRTSGVHSFSDSELKDIKAACDRPLSYVIFNNGPTAFADALRFADLNRV